MNMKKISIILLCLLMTACTDSKKNYSELALYQDDTVPDLQKNVESISKVLVVVPHADDEIAAAGLILYLKEKGATAHLMTLCDHGEPRQSELICSAEKIGFDKHETAGFLNNKWEDIISNKILFWRENTDLIEEAIFQKIDNFKPDALITYDAEIGATGHPEHLISAKITEKIFNKDPEEMGYKPQYLFQITLPKKLETFLVANSKMYKMTKKIEEVDGMTKPNLALDIKKYWPIKNAAALCHKSQMRILKNAYLVYEEADKESHINAFSKEYYKVLKRND